MSESTALPGHTPVGTLAQPARPRLELGARIAGIVRSEPTRAHLVVAALLYFSTGRLLDGIGALQLPHDRTFAAVLYLMWSGSIDAFNQIQPLFRLGHWVSGAAALALLAGAALPREHRFRLVHGIARRFYRYALALPLYTILVFHLGRFVANAIYALAEPVTWDLTPLIARLEGPAIEALQRAAQSPLLSSLAANFYSAVWLVPIALAGFVLVALDRPKAMHDLVVMYVLTAILAVPLFVLLPTFDAWSTNPAYGATGGATAIAYLYPNASAATLNAILTNHRWASGSALPSLHVAFPLVLALLFRKHGLRALSVLMGAMAAVTAFVVVYLGRHWIIDVVAAVPYALAVVWIARRVPVRVLLGPDGAAPPLALTYRPAAARVETGDASSARWLAMVFFVSGFAALLYQIVWQRTLFGIIGLNIEAVTLVVTVFMLGLGAGSLIGGALSKRPNAPLALLFAIAEVGIGVFGLFSLSLFHHLGRATLAMTPFWTAVSTFAMLLPPTILMGATLPLLVANQVRTQRNVGEAVGWLYFTNTLGSAAAAIAAGLLLLGRLGQAGTVQVAAILNIAVGALVYLRMRRTPGGR